MIQWLLDNSLRSFFGGARRGQPVFAALSAGTAVIAFLVKRRRPDKELLYGHNMKEGETLQISFLRNTAVVKKTDVEA